jgi:hypothetical protein
VIPTANAKDNFIISSANGANTVMLMRSEKDITLEEPLMTEIILFRKCIINAEIIL